MRSLAATITAVALLANVSHVHAADGVTAPVAGWCSATPEAAFFELADLVSDAKCASDASVRVDPHLVAMVAERLVYQGPREMGKPSGKEREIVFAWLPTPITDPDNPGQVVFAMNQYQSYVDLKKANAAWTNRVSAAGEKAGDFAATHLFIGPQWMKSGLAGGVKTGVDLAGAAAFQAPFVVMAPYTAGISMLPSTAMYAEALFMAPTGTAHGASEFVEGAKSVDFERALEGAAEFCGNVGIVLLAAAPVMEGGNALVPRARPPISLLDEGVAPTIAPPALGITETNSVGAARRTIYVKSPKHGLTQRGTAAPAPRNGQSALNSSVEFNANTSRRVGVDYDAGQFVVFDETHPGKSIFHGHVREWKAGAEPLTQEMQNALRKAGMADEKGRIIGRDQWFLPEADLAPPAGGGPK